MRMTFTLLFSALVALSVVGCGSDGRKPVYPAKGQVLVTGKPAQYAQVALHPLNPADKDAPHPTANVGPDGTFVLTTYQAQDGAPAGEYAVTVQWWLTSAKKGARESDDTPAVNRLPAR